MSFMRRGSIRGHARDASAAAENLPAWLSSLRAALSRIPLAWISIAALLALAVLGGKHVHAGLAKLGLGSLVLWPVLGGSAALVLSSQVMRARRALSDLMVCRMRACLVKPVHLGVRPSERAVQFMRSGEPAPPHVSRSVERVIVKALVADDDDFVIVITGPEKGASESLAHAVQHEQLGQRQLMVLGQPDGGDPEQLAALCSKPYRASLAWRATTVWAGDLGSRIKRGTLTKRQIDRLLKHHPKTKLVATLSTADYDVLMRGGSASNREGQAIVALARKITMPSRLSAAEVRDAARLYPRIPRTALPQLPAFLGAGNEIVERFAVSEATQPLAHAFTQAAIDWVRSGVSRPAPESFLSAACRVYLDARRRAPTARQLLSARRWAETPVGAHFGLIDPAPDGAGWLPSRLLVDDVRRQGASVPLRIFELVLEAVTDDADALLELGMGAAAQGQPEIATRSWERAAAVGDAGHQRIAMGHLWQLLRAGPAGPVDELLRHSRSHSLIRGLGARGPALLHSEEASSVQAFHPARPQPTTGWVARAYRLRTLRFLIRTTALMTLDLAGVVLGALLALGLKALLHGQPLLDELGEGAALATYTVAFALPVFALVGLYADEDHRRAQFTRITLALGMLAVLTSIAGAMRTVGLTSLTVTWASFLCAIPGCLLMRHLYERVANGALCHFKLVRRVLFVGGRRPVHDTRERVGRMHRPPTTYVGYLSNDTADRSSERLGSTDDFAAVLRDYGITSVIVVPPYPDADGILRLADLCQLAGATLDRTLSSEEVAVFGAPGASGHPLSLSRVSPAALTVGARLRKRCADLGGATVLLALLGLPILALAALVRLTSPGPAFVRCYRPGLGGQPFPLLKLRTSKIARPSRPSGAGAPVVPSTHASDVTPVGAFLRRFGLDELPQLVNVLRGEMSLVGPRPLPMADFRHMSAWHKRRYLVPPGITGAWQISGRRGQLDLDETARVDLHYMANWSLALDLQILLQTVGVVLSRPTDMPTPFP
jgi:lipopolysaccharide/colanic/teichoic acid biosynthesis glycosyltransferase